MAENADDMVMLTGAEQDVGDFHPSVATAADAEDLVITDNTELGVYEATIGT